MTLPTAPARRVRGGAVGLCTGALAVFAHTSADGTLPHVGVVVPLVTLLTWATSGLARRELTVGSLVLLIAGGQLAMHLAMSLATHHTGNPRTMLAAHVLATAVVVLVLAGAERTVCALARAIESVLPTKFTPLPATAPLAAPAPEPRHVTTSVVSLDVLSWRGPPAEQA